MNPDLLNLAKDSIEIALMIKTVVFAGYIVTSVVGLAILRHYLPQIIFPVRWDDLPARDVLLGLLLGGSLYIGSFLLWLLILRRMPLATAYPAAVGLTICGSTLVSVLILGEHIRFSQAAGIGLVLLGIVLILRSN